MRDVTGPQDLTFSRFPCGKTGPWQVTIVQNSLSQPRRQGVARGMSGWGFKTSSKL